MYSTHNEGKSVVAERFIRTLRNKIYKHIASVSKNVYIDKLDHIVNTYHDTYHSTIKIKSVDVKSKHILTLVKTLMIKILNLKLVILLEHQNINIFLQNVLNWSEEVFVVKKTLWHGYMLLVILKVKK